MVNEPQPGSWQAASTQCLLNLHFLLETCKGEGKLWTSRGNAPHEPELREGLGKAELPAAGASWGHCQPNLQPKQQGVLLPMLTWTPGWKAEAAVNAPRSVCAHGEEQQRDACCLRSDGMLQHQHFGRKSPARNSLQRAEMCHSLLSNSFPGGESSLEAKHPEHSSPASKAFHLLQAEQSLL